ncbi:hypothetical protein AJ88_14060 [Mesorhizobium amorphae CCBAU 01583]|nr:hypothetical protein AJ88_14060 [Mesorhizobium amorphae CCBAU 01583]
MQPTGSRLWRLAYRFEGKQKLLALGSYPLISLAEARQARDDAKRQLLSGIDPAQERSLRKTGSAKDTFRSIADEYLDKLKKEGRADRTISKVKWLLDFAYPLIGDKCIRESIRPQSLPPSVAWRFAVDMSRPGDFAPPSGACFDTQSRPHALRQIRRSP